MLKKLFNFKKFVPAYFFVRVKNAELTSYGLLSDHIISKENSKNID